MIHQLSNPFWPTVQVTEHQPLRENKYSLIVFHLKPSCAHIYLISRTVDTVLHEPELMPEINVPQNFDNFSAAQLKPSTTN